MKGSALRAVCPAGISGFAAVDESLKLVDVELGAKSPKPLPGSVSLRGRMALSTCSFYTEHRCNEIDALAPVGTLGLDYSLVNGGIPTEASVTSSDAPKDPQPAAVR